MTTRLALLALAISLVSCGDDDAPPAAPADPVLRPSGELLPWDLSAIVPIDSVRALPVGTPLYLRTEFAHGQLADLEMLLVQVVDDFLAPMPAIMVESSDPVLIQLGGIAQGMSGSPVFTEQGTLGAIAYGFGSQDSPPYYFFATPIEWVIGTQGTVPPAAKAAATWDGARITPLEIPLVRTGLTGPQPSEEVRSLWAQAQSAGLTRERQASFEAGRPLAVGLLLGEITGGSIGTLSYVDGNRVYGFGHPFNGVGPVALPIIEAKVLGEISNTRAPYKFATLNPTVRGTLTEDRLPGVRGVLDEEPDLVPIRSSYTFASGSRLELEHRMPAVGLDWGTASGLVSTAVFNPLANRIENEPGHSLRLTTNIAFTGTDSALARTRFYAEPDGHLFALMFQAEGDLAFAFGELMSRIDYALSIRDAEVHVELIREPGFAEVAEISADTVATLGTTLFFSVRLRVGRRADREIELELAIPDSLSPGSYRLEVGSAASLDDGGEDGGFFAGLTGIDNVGLEEGAETLEAVFARLNAPDEHTVLKARLVSAMDEGLFVFGSESDGEVTQPPDFSLADGPNESAVLSTEQEVGLYLEGTRSLQMELDWGSFQPDEPDE